MPKEFKRYPKRLAAYAKTFFGFGTWKADCWLIGIEEHGAANSDEFSSRYHAWKELKCNEGLVDLPKFIHSAEIPFEPTNSTWTALNKICLAFDHATEQLAKVKYPDKLKGWGRTKHRKGTLQVALIEAMPFPSPSTKDNDWPYTGWRSNSMKKRADCGSQFLPERSQIIADRFRHHKPMTVITYGSVFSSQNIPGLDIRGWISQVGNLPTARWEQFRIANGTKRKVTVFLKKVKWRSGKPSLIVFIPQPRFWRSSVPAYIGKQISVRQ